MADATHTPFVPATIPVRWSIYVEGDIRPRGQNIASIIAVAPTGVRINFTKEMRAGQRMILHFTLPLHGGPTEIIPIAEVKRVEAVSAGTGTRYATDLEFFDIDEGERDKVVRFVFEKEQQLRRKGLA